MRRRRASPREYADISWFGVAGLLRDGAQLRSDRKPATSVSHNERLEGTVVKRLSFLVICVVGVLTSAAPAQAAPILVVTTDTVFGTVVLDFVAGTETVTITGAGVAEVVDGAIVNDGVVSADAAPAPGTDDALFFDLEDEALVFDFDLASSVGIGTPVWTLLVAGSGLTPITDPTLSAFLVANNTGLFSLFGDPVVNTDQTGAPLSAVFTYTLESIAAPSQVQPIPEPATIGLVGMGILAAARARRARRKQDVA